MEYLLTTAEKVLVARYAYSSGIEYITDKNYDDLVYNKLPETHPFRYMLWEDVTFGDVEEILSKSGIVLHQPQVHNEDVSVQFESALDMKKDGTDMISMQSLMSSFPSPSSMQMVTDYADIYGKYVPQLLALNDSFNPTGQTLDLYQSYKMDGWNITCYFKVCDDKDLVLMAHTRGRMTSDVTDCTKIMRLIIPPINNKLCEVFNKGDIIRITGELVMYKSALPILREMYPDKSFSNVRNSISAFVHESIDIEKCYQMVAFYAYTVNSLEKGGCPFDTVHEVYEWLESIGLNVPPRYFMQIPIVDVNKADATKGYLEHCYKVMEDYYVNTFSEYFECDGLVLQPDQLSWNEHIQQIVQGSFGDGLVAIKARYWAEKIYQAVVSEIVYPKARSSRSVMAIVKPVTTALGQVVRRVPLINLQRAVIENDVRVGDTIEFVYHSNQLPFFLKNISQIERRKHT